MKIKQIEYGRLFNLGNFENEKFGLIAELDKKESIEKAAKILKQTIIDLRAKSDSWEVEAAENADRLASVERKKRQLANAQRSVRELEAQIASGGD